MQRALPGPGLLAPACHGRRAFGGCALPLHHSQACTARPQSFGRQSKHQRGGPCAALESYLEDKLRTVEATYKELSLRMADPDVAADPAEFQKARLLPALPRIKGLVHVLLCVTLGVLT